MRLLPFSPMLQALLPNGLATLLNNMMLDRRVNIGPLQPLVIASNAVTIPANGSNFSIDAVGASTDLNSILGALDGDVIFVRSLSSARAIVFKHGVDNILCNGSADLTVSDLNDLVQCVYDGTTSKWKCILWPMG